MTEKKNVRKLFKSMRNSLADSERDYSDKRIATCFINSNLFNYDSLLIYVSSKGEPDTSAIIDYALNVGKKVAVPYCSGKKMTFHFITSFEDLSEGSFGIPEPDPAKCIEVDDFSRSVCIVPGISFDLNGNRLGYGGGFYDRFLSEHSVITVGLSYERCLCHQLPSEEHDIAINYLITENGIRNSKKEVST